jgi:hypothetical protein
MARRDRRGAGSLARFVWVRRGSAGQGRRGRAMFGSMGWARRAVARQACQGRSWLARFGEASWAGMVRLVRLGPACGGGAARHGWHGRSDAARLVWQRWRGASGKAMLHMASRASSGVVWPGRRGWRSSRGKAAAWSGGRGLALEGAARQGRRAWLGRHGWQAKVSQGRLERCGQAGVAVAHAKARCWRGLASAWQARQLGRASIGKVRIAGRGMAGVAR